MIRFFLLILAGLYGSGTTVDAQRTHSRRMGSSRHGYYSSMGRNLSGRRWNNGAVNALNSSPSSHNKGFTIAHVPQGVYYGAQVQIGSASSYYYAGSDNNRNHFDVTNNDKPEADSQESRVEDTELTTEVITEPEIDTPATTERILEEGLFMKRLRFSSGPHIVRDSWCRVSESKDCVPAL